MGSPHYQISHKVCIDKARDQDGLAHRRRKLVSKIFRFASIQVAPFFFNHLEVVICGNLGIAIDKCGGVFIQVTIDVLDLGKTNLARVRTVSR